MLAERIVEPNLINREIGCQLTIDDYIDVMYPKKEECGYVALAHKVPQQKKRTNLKKNDTYGKTAEEVYEMSLSGELKKEKDVPYDFVQRSYKVNELLEHVNASMDCYASMNTFYITRRQKTDIRHLNALFVDIDYYNVPGVTKQTVLDTLNFNVNKGLIPYPTFIIDSGRGLYFIWKIEDVPGKFVRANRLYGIVQDYIYKLFKDVGADVNAKDVSRVLRLPSTKNTKANKDVEIIDYNETSLYTLRFFQEYVNVFGEHNKAPKTKKTKAIKAQFEYLFNTFTLNLSRMRDIETICQLRDYNVTGLRDQIIYIYYYYSLLIHRDKHIALFNTKELNAKFVEPLLESEVRSFIVSAERSAMEKIEGKEAKSGYKYAGYNFKSETLIKILKITDEEQKHLKTIISLREKYDRNNVKRTPRNENGLTKRQQDKQNLVERVKELKEKGYKQREIAEMMEITERHVKRIYKELREQN